MMGQASRGRRTVTVRTFGATPGTYRIKVETVGGEVLVLDIEVVVGR